MATTESDQLSSNWSELPHELLLNVVTRLTIEDRWVGPMLVCKSWLEACKDPSLYTVFDLESSFKSRPAESTRWWTTEFERKIDNMVCSIVDWCDGRRIVEVRVSHCSDRSLSVVAQRCPDLEVLSITSCPNVTDESMIKLASGCPKLKELNISYCYEISHESLLALGRKCTNITVLKRNLMNLDSSQHIGFVPTSYLDACPQDGDSEATAIGNLMPQLLHLELRFSKLSARGLALITQGCKNLEYLDLSGCMNVTSRDIATSTSGLTNLKTIKKPNFYIPRSGFQAERYDHWRLYDDRFQTDAFRI